MRNISETIHLDREAKRALKRLLPRLEKELSNSISVDPTGWHVFSARLKKHFSALFDLYLDLYSTRYDCSSAWRVPGLPDLTICVRLTRRVKQIHFGFNRTRC